MAKSGIFIDHFLRHPLDVKSTPIFTSKLRWLNPTHRQGRYSYSSIGTLYLHAPHLESINGMYRD